MTSKHTPGPWINKRDLQGRITATVDGREHSVAFTAMNDGVSAADSFANARLIAAAPDLLAALQGALDLLEHARHFYNGPHSAEFNFIDTAKAALARARGE